MTVLAGVHEQYQGTVDHTTPDKTLERYPLCAVTREFNNGIIKPQNLVPKLRNLCEEVWAEGMTVVVSFKLSVAEVLNGQWGPYVKSAAAWLKDNGHDADTIFCIWHEPENDVPTDFKSAAQFVQYFNIVHDWVKGAAPKLLTMHAAVTYRYADKNKGTAAKPNMVPIDIDDDTAKVWGKTKADIKAADVYSGRSFPLATILPELSGFRRWVTHTVGDAPYAITERGWMADTAEEFAIRETTVKREADWLRSDPVGRRCVLYIAWLTRGTENDPTLKPDAKMSSAVNYLLAKVNEPDPEQEPEDPEPVGQPTVECPLCHGAGSVDSGQTYTIVKTTAKG